MSVTIASKRLSNLGEGPHWDVNTKKLYYVDAFVGDVCRLDPSTKETESVTFDGTVTFVIPYQSDSNNLLVSLGKQVRKLNFNDKTSEVVAVVEPGNPNSRFNDAKCDPKGRLWTGTLEEGKPGRGYLYRMDSAYEFKSFADKITLSNGLTWSLDFKRLFYIDSEKRTIYTFDFDLEAGTASNQKILVDYSKDEGYGNLGAPDGMTTDIEGKLWVACYGGGCILRIDPHSGKILRKIPIPATNVTSCCFGGPDFNTLYVTTAWMGREESERTKEPQAGAVFAVTDLGICGQCPYHFIN